MADKDTLKARGYRWSGEANDQPRAWYTDMPDGAHEQECAILCGSIYGRPIELPMRRLTAWKTADSGCTRHWAG